MTEKQIISLRKIAKGAVSMNNHFKNVFSNINAEVPKVLNELCSISERLLNEANKDQPKLEKVKGFIAEIEELQQSEDFKKLL